MLGSYADLDGRIVAVSLLVAFQIQLTSRKRERACGYNSHLRQQMRLISLIEDSLRHLSLWEEKDGPSGLAPPEPAFRLELTYAPVDVDQIYPDESFAESNGSSPSSPVWPILKEYLPASSAGPAPKPQKSTDI